MGDSKMKEWKKPEVKNLGIYETEDGDMACGSTSEAVPLYDFPLNDICCVFRENGKCTNKHYGKQDFWIGFIHIKNATWPCPKASESSVGQS